MASKLIRVDEPVDPECTEEMTNFFADRASRDLLGVQRMAARMGPSLPAQGTAEDVDHGRQTVTFVSSVDRSPPRGKNDPPSTIRWGSWVTAPSWSMAQPSYRGCPCALAISILP